MGVNLPFIWEDSLPRPKTHGDGKGFLSGHSTSLLASEELQMDA